jgi:hypothetical protein
VVPNRQGGTDVQVTLDNASVGHGWPSGASQDRRAWVELIAYEGDQAVYQTGVVADDQAVGVGTGDPDLWLLRDIMRDATGAETHMFWNAASYTSIQLPPAVTNVRSDPRFYHAVTKTFTLPPTAHPDRITLRVRIRAIGLEVIDDLITSGDLDSSYRSQIPIFDALGAQQEWKASSQTACVP